MTGDEIEGLTDWAELMRNLEESDTGVSKRIDAPEMAAALKKRVVGQDHVVDSIALKIRERMGLEKRDQPVYTALFAGPPATGKTELSKAITEYLFEDQKNMVFIECPKLGTHSKWELAGVPAGYQGHGKPGKLTGPVLSHKERVVVFDEVEKADEGVLDLLLPLLNEGRLHDDGVDEWADFTHSIILLTSNANWKLLLDIQSQVDDPFEQMGSFRNALQKPAGPFKPEIISRMNQVYVFKPLPQEVRAKIVLIKARKLVGDYGLALDHIDPLLVAEAIKRGGKVSKTGDTRQQENVLQDMLASPLIDAKHAGLKTVCLGYDKLTGAVRVTEAAKPGKKDS